MIEFQEHFTRGSVESHGRLDGAASAGIALPTHCEVDRVRDDWNEGRRRASSDHRISSSGPMRSSARPSTSGAWTAS